MAKLKTRHLISLVNYSIVIFENAESTSVSKQYFFGSLYNTAGVFCLVFLSSYPVQTGFNLLNYSFGIMK
jgi:hypothetical protein